MSVVVSLSRATLVSAGKLDAPAQFLVYGEIDESTRPGTFLRQPSRSTTSLSTSSTIVARWQLAFEISRIAQAASRCRTTSSLLCILLPTAIPFKWE